MAQAPNLLNDDGTASMATALMMSHHAFRRDLARFERALEELPPSDRARAAALQNEWQGYRAALHGHHEMEDKGIFPGIAAENAEVAATVQGLGADHRRIDPLLERGDRAFAALEQKEPALGVVRELKSLLTPHLATEEERIVPFLRGAKSFPTPATDAEADLYAKGFSWAMHGIAPAVLDQLNLMLPAALVTRLPAAQREFAERCVRAWGSDDCGAATTPIPNGP